MTTAQLFVLSATAATAIVLGLRGTVLAARALNRSRTGDSYLATEIPWAVTPVVMILALIAITVLSHAG